MRKLLILLSIVCPLTSVAASFDNHENTIIAVGGYSQNISYDTQHCIVRFSANTPTACANKVKAVIYSDKQIGNLMCSIALTALVSEKAIKVSSTDQCDPIHGAPILRYIEAVK